MNTIEVKFHDHYKLYVLLEDSYTFEDKLIENNIPYYLDDLGQPNFHHEGVRFFLRDADRKKINQIVIENNISSSTETIRSFVEKSAEMNKFYIKVAIVVIVLLSLISVFL
jgi:hypothetical protein